MIDYDSWKVGPARDLLLRTFEFDTATRACWSAFQTGFIAHLDETAQDPQEAVTRTPLSTSETLLVAAALYAADLREIGDRMLAPGFFYRLDSASDAMLAAALAPVLRRCGRDLPEHWRRNLPVWTHRRPPPVARASPDGRIAEDGPFNGMAG